MKAFRNIGLSVKALFLNKSRTYLSIAGMAVGIAAVMITMAIGEGAKRKALEPIKAMGANVIVVNAGKYTETFGRKRQIDNVTTLKLSDSESLSICNHVSSISAFQEKQLPIKFGNLATSSLVQGVMPEYPAMRNYTLRAGDFFTKNQNNSSERVAVLGSIAADNIFKNEDPVNKTIYINKIPFKVIGVLNLKGTVNEMGNIDNVVMIPVKTILRRVLNIDYVGKVYLQIDEMANMDKTEKFVIEQLRANHKLNELEKKNDFTIVNQLNTIRATEETSRMFNILILGVAGISLIIGGVGILAVMILSVRERIKEIGLRISVGARKKNIVFQFLFESFMLGSAGGVGGILVGFTAAWILNEFSDWTTYISAYVVVVSILFSMITGLIFGVIPAQRAAKLDPIESLRAE